MSDSVNNPNHYTSGGVECIDGIRAALGESFADYCRGNVLKYVWRCGKKGDSIEDLRKAAKYLEWAIEAMEGNSSESQSSNHVEGVWVEEAGKVEPTEWIPKAGDKVRVVKPGRTTTGKNGVVVLRTGNYNSVWVKDGEITSHGLLAKDLELIEAAK